MAWRAKLFGGLLSSLLSTISLSAQAESVACHLTYGGETQLVETAPTNAPYVVAPVALGSYFLFRIVFRQTPADLAGIKLYTYADRDSGPVIIHQTSFPYPVKNAAVNGFTGLNLVYEPVRDGELHYWCEIKTEAAK